MARGFGYYFLLLLIGGSYLLWNITIVKLDGVASISNENRTASIQIYRDDHGIPRIFANSLPDALYGMGWTHAQDRLWSMNLRRMLFSGRLAEMLDVQLIRVDQYMRSIGILRSARNDAKNLDEETRTKLQAYVDGINDYVATLIILPFEFQMTRSKFTNWTVTDCLVFHKFMSFSLTHDWQTQLFRTRLATLFGKERACEILACSTEYLYDKENTILNDDELKASGLYEPATPREPFFQGPSDKLIDFFSLGNNTKNESKPKYDNKLEERYFNMVNDLMKGLKGSNSWVIGGKHTASGKPLLANDPHLDNSMPSVWTQVELRWGDKSIIGATIPGYPIVAVGKSDHLTWGVTTLYADTSDVYLEKLNDAGNKYFFEGAWQDIIRYEEIIKVKGGKDEIFVVNATRHGPILSDIMENFHIGQGSENLLEGNFSFAWTGHIEQDSSLPALFRVYDYESLEDFKKDTAHVTNPSQNLVLAFKQGDIVYTALGLLPVRHDQFEGAFVKDGTKRSSEWLRYAKKSENPQAINPAKGYIVTANNKFATDNIKNSLSRTQVSTPRAARISELIEGQIKRREKFTVEDMKKIQLDTVDVYARQSIKKILQMLQKYRDEMLGDTTHRIDRLLDFLNDWEGSFDRFSKGASVYATWEYLFNLKLFHDSGLSERERDALFSHMSYDQFFFRYIDKWAEGQNLNESFCVNDANRFKTDKPCMWNLVYAFMDTYNYLWRRFSGDTTKWDWRELHHNNYNHAPFSSTMLRSFYHRSKYASGNKRTPNVAVYYPQNHNFEAAASANLRMVTSWEPLEQDFFIIDSGVSESWWSSHYDDQLFLHMNETYLNMSLTDTDQLFTMKNNLTLSFEHLKIDGSVEL